MCLCLNLPYLLHMGVEEILGGGKIGLGRVCVSHSICEVCVYGVIGDSVSCGECMSAVGDCRVSLGELCVMIMVLVCAIVCG